MLKKKVEKKQNHFEQSSTSQDDLLKFVEELKRQWMATIDALVDPLMFVKTDYTVTKANKAMGKMAGTGVKDLLGKTCYKVFAKRDKPCPGCKMEQAGKKAETATFSLDHIDGNRFFEVTSQPVFNSNNELDGVVQVYRDRTEAKRLQEQLMQSEKLASIGLLAGGFAHEINNPLGGILVFSQMILKEMAKDNQFYEDVVEIEAATKRCKEIVDNLLEFARQSPAKQDKESSFEDVNVIETMESALRFGKVSHKHKQIDIEKKWIEDELVIHANRNKLIQLFLNLIKNAFEAMPDGGTVTLSARRIVEEGEPVGIFEVKDTGIGMSAKNVKKIFDPFFTTKEPGEGTGLGLAVCYGIVTELNGKIEVESTPNVGTCFRVKLPMSSAGVNKKAS